MIKTACLIPVYNMEATIASAIQSAFEFDEIIVLDDGSTDDTLTVARSMGVDVFSVPHQGIQACRNSLLGLTNADVVAYLDADDRRLPGMLAMQLAALDGVDFVYSPILNNSHVIHLTGNLIADLLGQSLQTGGYLCHRLALTWRSFPPWRVDAGLRHEYWFGFDLLKADATWAYFPHAASTYQVGLFTRSIAPDARLEAYQKLVAEMKDWLGDRWDEYKHVADIQLALLRYEVRQLRSA